MSKKEELDKLKSEMEKDDNLPLKTSETNLVFGVGNPETKILFCGEGPGYWENLKEEPFVGNAGKLLDNLLESINLPRSEVYITNVVHHRPPENRDPLPKEILAYGKYLDEIIKIINPKAIVTLGRFSMGKFLPGAKISGVHGKMFDAVWNSKSITIVPMYHPAAALRSGAVMEQIKNDFLKLPSYLKEIESKIEVEQTQLF